MVDRAAGLPGTHLSDGELYALALPPAGEPEALPSHLLRCAACARALQEWKSAVRDIKQQDADAVGGRTAEEWSDLEQATLAAVRRAGRRRAVLPWAAGLAASLLVVALVATARRTEPPTAPAASSGTATTKAAVPDAGELAGQDLADDTLLREVADLTGGGGEGSGSWSGLAPDPSPSENEGSL